MSDTTLNRFLAQGTNAERLAFTPNPPTPASGPDPGYLFYETDTGDMYAWDDVGSAWVQVTSAGAFTNPMTTSQDLIVGGASGTPGRLAVGAPGRVLTVGSGGIIDWEVTAPVGGAITASGYTMATAKMLGRATAGTGAIEEIAVTGSGSAVLATSPTLVTPALGTPSALVLTNATGLPVATGISGLGTGVATFLATPSSANLGSALTDKTGTGVNVFATSPTLVTPALGTPTALVLTNATGLPLTTGVTGILPVANGGTATATPALVAGTNVTITGTWPNQTINSSAGGSGTVNSGTATQFAYYSSTGTTIDSTATLTVSAAGRLAMTPTAVSSGVASYLTITAPADTALTAATEAIGINIPGSTRQHASNTGVATQREIVIGGPVYSFASATGTISDAITLSVSAPTAGTNAVLTRRTAISIPDGGIAFGTVGTQGTITSAGSTGNLAITAGGTDQNITINPSGTGIIAYGTPSAVLPTAAMGVFGSSDQTGRIFIRRASADAFAGAVLFSKSRNTMASPNTVSSGDVLGNVQFGGFDGTNWAENCCRIQVNTTEAWSTGAHGNELRFYTNTTATTTSILGLTIGNDGSLKSAAPSGGTAAAWKFGILVTAGVVPDTTRYIQLDVGGTLYKLIVST